MAGTSKEAVVSCLPLDKPQNSFFFFMKNTHRAYFTYSCVNVRPADVLISTGLSWFFLPVFLANCFEAGESI